MKVLMIEPIGYSGIGIYTAQLLGGLLQAGCEAALLTSRVYDPASMKPAFPFHPVLGGGDRTRSRLSRLFDYLASWVHLPGILRRERPDIVHVQNSLVPFIDLFVILSLRAAGYPVAYTVHDVDRSAMMTSQRLRILLNRYIDRAVYWAASRLIVHTHNSGEELGRLYGIPPGRIQRINFGNQAFHLEGVPLPGREEARRKLGLEPGDFVVLFFGDRRPSKGLDLLIRAAAPALKAVPALRLVIAGERRVLDTTDYLALAGREGVAAVCSFHDGFIPKENVPVFFAACDLVALPYRKIYQSAVVHLAFSFGRAVLASRQGGLVETVEEGKTGFFVDDPEDIGALAEALLTAWRARGSLDAMGEAGRRYEVEEFDWKVIGERTLEMYQSLRGAG